MGIVRDITVDQLTQAVNNIDTSTLAQDSTLQDVVTAIGNISGGSDPVTNTTVNTLGKDTTLQSIATAITALGSTLGSDKANIDGSNIANPSAFRQAIQASKVSVTEYTVTGTTNNQGYLATSYDFNNYLLSIRATDSTNVGLYAIARPSLQGKVVVMCINDLLQGFASQDVIIKLRYLTVS